MQVIEETDESGTFLMCVAPGLPLFMSNVLKMGWTFGPAIPSPEACALADRAPEMLALLRDCLWTMRKLNRSKTPTKEEVAVSALLAGAPPPAEGGSAKAD